MYKNFANIKRINPVFVWALGQYLNKNSQHCNQKALLVSNLNMA